MTVQPMPFPTSERVIYDKNTLTEVLFQVRFPRLLQFDSELPADFQKAVLGEYPLLEEKRIVRFAIAAGGTEMPTMPDTSSIVYDFISENRGWKVSLANDFVAVSTSNYVRWEEFQARALAVVGYFLGIYRIPVFTRIGLRYQNIIDRTRLQLGAERWSTLLKPFIAGELLTDAFTENQFVGRQCAFTIQLDNGDHVQVVHGTMNSPDAATGTYRLDSDFYNATQHKADTNVVNTVTNRLHDNSGHFFRWAITDVLHRAMGPKPI